MFVSNMDAWNHFHNNDQVKQKNSQFQILFVYLFTHTWINFSVPLKLYIIHIHIYSHWFICISMKSKYHKSIELMRFYISHIHWPLVEEVKQKLWMSITFNKKTRDFVRWKNKNMSIDKKRKEVS